MHPKQAAAERSLQTWSELQRLSTEFEARLIEKGSAAGELPKFEQVGKTIVTNILGYSLILKKRAIAVDGQLGYMEISFIHVRGEEVLPIMSLYLDSSGSVWRHMGEHKLCNYNDTRLLPVVFNELVVAVLNSSLSSPVKCV